MNASNIISGTTVASQLMWEEREERRGEKKGRRRGRKNAIGSWYSKETLEFLKRTTQVEELPLQRVFCVTGSKEPQFPYL